MPAALQSHLQAPFTSATDVLASFGSCCKRPLGGVDMVQREQTSRAVRYRREITKLKVQLRQGSSIAANNIAATYRQLGHSRRAFHWWQRAAGPHHGDAWLEVGYCLQYGIGVRRDMTASIDAYRRAIASHGITMFGREEAQYHLAIALLDRSRSRSRRSVERLLGDASADGDYPQAADLLRQLRGDGPLRLCRCRRWLRVWLGGRAHCGLHRATARTRTRETLAP
jgi:TPR repeat protein